MLEEHVSIFRIDPEDGRSMFLRKKKNGIHLQDHAVSQSKCHNQKNHCCEDLTTCILLLFSDLPLDSPKRSLRLGISNQNTVCISSFPVSATCINYPNKIKCKIQMAEFLVSNVLHFSNISHLLCPDIRFSTFQL
jgi:hypothetical protein